MSVDHKLATSNKKQCEVFSKIVNEKFEKNEAGISAIFKIVALMIEQDIADRKLHRKVDSLKQTLSCKIQTQGVIMTL